MRAEGQCSPAVPHTRGVPVPTQPRGGVHITERQPEVSSAGWWRKPSPVEFTPEQLKARGYRPAGTGTKARRVQKKATPKAAPAKGRGRAHFDHPSAVRDYLAGDSSGAVASRYGVTAQSVLNAVRAAGHTPRPRNQKGRATG